MEEDIYLSTVADLFMNGVWNEEMVIKQVLLHAEEKGLDKKDVDDFLRRLVPAKTYSNEEMRNFLKNVTFENGELKYPNAVDDMADYHVEQLFNIEKDLVKKEDIRKIINGENRKKKEEPKVEKEQPVENKENTPEIIEKDKMYIGNNEGEYSINFRKLREEENKNKEEVKPVVEKKEEHKVKEEPAVEKPKFVGGPIPKIKIELEKEEELKEEPTTEEDYEQVHDNITDVEEDSNVRVEEVSEERMKKLKKSKGRALNYFLKGAIVVAAVLLLHPVEAIPLIGGYMYFSSKIESGTFNPKTKVGEAVKKVVKSIMNIGMPKEEERGKTR